MPVYLILVCCGYSAWIISRPIVYVLRALHWIE